MYQTYSLTRAFDADDMRAQTFTVSDDDAINCAHMLAAGFNTMSRNHMLTFVMAVVDTETGIVQYNGKTEQIARPEPWSTSHTFTFNPTAGDADTILTLFGNGETPTFTAAGKFSFVETATDEEVLAKASADLMKASAGKLARSVLEEAYGELQAVKDALYDAGAETIPADAGVRDLADMHLAKSKTIEGRDVEIAGLVQERINANERIAELERRDEHERYARQTMERKHGEEKEALRAELLSYMQKARAKYQKLDPTEGRDDLKQRFGGMLDVFSRFLAATGEADYDERHAVARRLVENPED